MKKKSATLSRRRLLKGMVSAVPPLLLSAPMGTGGCGRRKPPPRPNIIVILIDALRADRLGLYGHDADTSLALDRFASEGVTFERTFAQAPWTQPSVASLFSSTYPSVHKVVDYGLARRMKKQTVRKLPVFNANFTTLAEVLQHDGYETAGFITNFVLSSVYGFAQGFDHYVDMPLRNKKGGDMPGGALNREVIDWLIQRRSQRPLFLYLHYMDVHGPYFSRPDFFESRFAALKKRTDLQRLTDVEREAVGYLEKRQAAPIVDRYRELSQYREFWSVFYDACVREMDQLFLELRDGLARLGLWDDSYILVTSDHGEAFLEHGYWQHGLGLHNHQLYVPLLLRWPGHLPAGRRIPGVVRLIDVMPTLLDQLGLPVSRETQGRSLVGDLTGEPPERSVPAFSEGVKYHPRLRSLVLNDHKLIFDAETNAAELYDLGKDPRERHNIFSPSQRDGIGLAEGIRKQVARNQRLASRFKSRDVALSAEEMERLKSLGYL